MHRAIGQAGVVVEGNVAASYRGFQLPTGLGQAAAGHRQLPIARGRFRGGEIEVVGNSNRFGPHTTEVAGRLRHRRHAPPLRIKGHPTVGTIQRGRHPPLARLQGPRTLLEAQAQHSGIGGPWQHHCVGLHLVVVLAPHPGLAGDGWVIQQLQQHRLDRLGLQRRQAALLPTPMGLNRLGRFRQQLPLVNGRVFRQGPGRHLRRHRPVLQHPHQLLLQHPAHHRRLQSPAPEAFHQRLLAARLHHKQHPFLGFRQQEVVGGHPRFPGGHQIQIQLDAHMALGGHLGAAAGEASGTHVLGGQHITAFKGLKAGLNQSLLQKRVTHLHRRPVIQGGFAQFSTGKAGAAHAIPASGAAHINHRITHTDGARAHDFRGFHQPQGHGIHQGIS